MTVRGGSAQTLMNALTAPWAKDNAEIQALVDKVLADQKAVQAAQAAQNEALAAFVAANRGTDAAAAAAARKVLDDANRKLAEDNRALNDDMRALNGKMSELNPNRERPPAPRTAPAGGEGGGREG